MSKIDLAQLRSALDAYAVEEKKWREDHNMQLYHEICEVKLPNGDPALVFIFIDNPTAHILFTPAGEVTVYSFPGDDASVMLRTVLDIYNYVAARFPVGPLGAGGVLAPVYDKEKNEVSYESDFNKVMTIHTVEALKGRLMALQGFSQAEEQS